MMTNGKMTTTEAIAGWYRWGKAGGLAPHTVDQYSGMVTEFFRTSGKEYPEVSPEDLVLWAEVLNKRGPTVSSCGHKALTNFWKWLRLNGLDDRVVTEHMPFTQPRRKVPVAFSPEELAEVFDVSVGLVNTRHGRSAHLYFKFLYYTGARSHEALTVKTNELEENSVLLRNTKRGSSGTGAERLIPLSAAGALMVPAWRDEVNRRGFETRLFPWGRTTAGYWCELLTDRLGFHVHAHKFRATFATNLLTRGVDIRTVQELLGHADVSTTMRYLAVTDERKLAAVSVL